MTKVGKGGTQFRNEQGKRRETVHEGDVTRDMKTHIYTYTRENVEDQESTVRTASKRARGWKVWALGMDRKIKR